MLARKVIAKRGGIGHHKRRRIDEATSHGTRRAVLRTCLGGKDLVAFTLGKGRAPIQPGHRNQRAPGSSILRLPVGVIAVVFVNAGSPSPVREIWPLGVLVKPGSRLQLLLVHIEHEHVRRLDEAVLRLGELECTPRYGEQLITHTQEATEGENSVGHATFLGVDHQFVDLAQIFILAIDHRLADDFRCQDDTVTFPMNSCSLLSHLPPLVSP